jgi:hypothetical protein
VVRPTSPSQVSALSYHPGTGRQGRRCEAPALLVTLWPARPSPHQPASASHSRLTRSPDCRFRRGQSHPVIDVRPCGAAGAPPGINHQGEAQTTSPEPASPVPRHRAGHWCVPLCSGGSQTGAQALPRGCLQLILTPHPPGQRERRPGGHRARHRRLLDRDRSARPDRYRNCPHPCTIWCRRRISDRMRPSWRVHPTL